ncbi:hypothetical protein WICPIJ_008626 [Wickerhamomyces pijperi]|uniref:SET domain-containing protein n=1 Tax=Wickerhamomyces pijperi TaxID=599730 RepID=A0A9P8PVY5_WICPI|nr:hypothetical protein WICPIJ_008626 [Wickerhamomyces pijperi]
MTVIPNDIDNLNQLNRISPLFDIQLTSYGGRACFSTQDIPKGTEVLLTSEPIGSVILYEFRKEVCSSCLKYVYGEVCKIKADEPKVANVDEENQTNSKKKGNKKKFQGAGLWFCSEECKVQYQSKPSCNQLIETFETLLTYYQTKVKSPEVEDDDSEFKPIITKEYIDSFWEEVNQWDITASKTKHSKLVAQQLPKINSDEYTTVRFVTSVLHNLHHTHSETSVAYYHSLQSNEEDKIRAFPTLLLSQTLVYKFLRICLPEHLQPLLSTDHFRELCGREYGNSFGIWQQTSTNTEAGSIENENKEFLGYSLYPEASYFNHSCGPNLRKIRVRDRMQFETIKDISKGEQMCIDYFHILDEPRDERQKILKKNWFFDCGCDRCENEKI